MEIIFELNKQESAMFTDALKSTSLKAMGMNYQTVMFFIGVLKEGEVKLNENQTTFLVNLILSGCFDWNLVTVEHFKKKIMDAVTKSQKKETPLVNAE